MLNGYPVTVYEFHELGPLQKFMMAQTKQMSMNQGLKDFGAAGSAVTHKEMKQLYSRKVSIPVDPSSLSRGDKSSALRYLMFLKQKRDGAVKGRCCANGSKYKVNKE